VKVRSFEIARAPLHDGSELLYAPLTRAMHVESALVARVLAACAASATLEEHAARVRSSLGAPVANVDVLGLLRRLLDVGLLVSHDAVAERLPTFAPTARAPLRTLVVPTKDRPALLERAVATFAANAGRWGRRCTIVVVDDARVGHQVGSVLARLDAHGASLVLFDDAERRRFADALAQELGGDPANVAHALALGVDDGRITTGAARNLALLACAGERYVSVDDDQVCRLAETGDGSFGVSSTDPTELLVFPDRRATRTAGSISTTSGRMRPRSATTPPPRSDTAIARGTRRSKGRRRPSCAPSSRPLVRSSPRRPATSGTRASGRTPRTSS